MVVRDYAGWFALLISSVSISAWSATPGAPAATIVAAPEKPATTSKAPLKVNVSSALPAPSAPQVASSTVPQTPPPLERPQPDALLVKKAIDVSAEEPADGRTRLGLRLAVVARGPAEPWLLAVINRGTEPVRVLFDLRLLSLEVSPPPTQEPEKGRAKPAKPVVCKLPANARPDVPRSELEAKLAPGEGLVDSFDPRLFCFTSTRKSPLVGGARVVAHLGFAEKTKAVWKKGKRETLVVEQSPPFVARRATAIPDLTEIRAEPARDPGPEAPRSDIEAVKELIAPTIEVAPEAASALEPPSEPFELSVVEGSDAKTGRGVTVAVSIINRSPQARYLYFRRELLSFEVSGPNGFVSCEPGPDARAPDRQSYTRVNPGGRVSATSRLIELCPFGTFDDPGLYLIGARFESTRAGAEFELDAFTGQLESRTPVTVRVQEGPKPMSPGQAPLAIRIGAP
jgi:hypothetical protein